MTPDAASTDAPAPARDALLAAALEAADAAGAAIRPWFRAPDPGTERKADLSPVTRADREAEQAMRAAIARRFPDHAVLGEEYGLAGEGRFRWVLDPIDGTRAFITGRPSFATLVGLLDGETPVLGVVDQPVTGERWIGIRGEATRFAGRFGGTVGTRQVGTLAEAELSATSPAMFEGALAQRFAALAARAGRVSWGGDAYAYGLLALGRIDVIAEASMKVWDWAALRPVVEGAGGRVTAWDGTPLRADGDGTVLAAASDALHAEAVAALAG